MEFMTMVTLINIGAFTFVALTIYQAWRYRAIMSHTAYHHLLSHASLVTWLVVSLDMFLFYGFIFPLLFAFLYMLQHVLKENNRLIKTNQWSVGVSDD